jgi:CrcB protein
MASTVESEPHGEAGKLDQTDTQQHAVDPPATARRRPRGRFGDPSLLVAVFVGGAIGALLRAALTRYLPDAADGFPWTVFAINVGGAIVLAYVAIRLQERLPPSTYRRPLVGTGFCGALTTFSTLQVTVVRLGRDGQVALGALYLLASICVGVVAVVLTTAVTRRARFR